MDINSYLSGYADGEGCFCVTFNKSKRHRFGWDIRPSFSVSQNRDKSEVIEEFQRRFGCGYIRPDRSDKTLKYEVRSIKDLIEKIIPHFEQYPLLSGKQQDFEKFRQICDLMNKKKHLTPEGLRKVVELSSEINPAGKKKYPRLKIKIQSAPLVTGELCEVPTCTNGVTIWALSQRGTRRNCSVSEDAGYP